MLVDKLLQKLKTIPKTYFSLADIRKFYEGNLNSLPVILSRMVKRGVLTKIRRGYFTFDLNQVDFEDFACAIKKPSYISLEYALYYYGLIDQVPESITLVTTGKSQTLFCNGKTLEYSHINLSLFFGYEIVKNTLIACKEKVILDELYLISLKKRSFNINPDWFKDIDKKLFKKWARAYPKCLQNLLNHEAWRGER